MPRTAITLAKSHKGKWALVSGPDVPIQQQLQDFRLLLGAKSHPENSEILIQESDGHARIHRMRSPKDHAAHEARRAAETASAKAAGEKLKKESEAATKGKQPEAKAEEKPAETASAKAAESESDKSE